MLYLAPTFLSYRLHKLVRGVQVFDLQLVEQLVACGLDVTVPAEVTWRGRRREHLGGLMSAKSPPGAGRLRVVYTPPFFKPLWNGLALNAVLHRRFDVCFVGNATRGIAPVVSLMLKRRLFPRVVVQANRLPREGFCRALRRWPATITAVSGMIRDTFPDDLRPRVEVCYGIANAGLFHPGPRQADAAPRERVRFVMLGKLDTPIKGVASALAAWRMLPAGVRGGCELHLASFPEPPAPGTLPEGVIAHRWLGADEVPGLLREMDVMLVPSLSETFGQGLVQAMLTGLPSVVRDVPTLVEKVAGPPEAGLVFQDDAGLARAIERLAGDAGLRAAMGQRARRVALERFVWDTPRFVERYLLPGWRAPGRK